MIGPTCATLPKGETDVSGGGLKTSHGRSLADRVLFALLIVVGLAALWAVPSYYLGRTSVVWARVETDRT